MCWRQLLWHYKSQLCPPPSSSPFCQISPGRPWCKHLPMDIRKHYTSGPFFFFFFENWLVNTDQHTTNRGQGH